MYFLVPHEVSATTATLWAAAVDEQTRPDQWRLLPAMPGQAPPGEAGQWPAGSPQPRLRHLKIEITGLAPRQTYEFALLAGGQRVADARVTTLPRELPLLGDKPFVALLGSCFSYREDRENKVGSTFAQLPVPARPDVKFLAGDQVYLDSPWERFLGETHSVRELHAMFVDHYKWTWGQADGFGRLLKEGANYFSSDDHEFWNNAPNIASFIRDTWPPFGKRDEWWQAARALYCAFQTAAPIQEFSVPPVSFLVADTRMNRSRQQTEFMEPDDLDRVAEWVRTLQGPGVLVIGQPLLQTSTGFLKGHVADWNLPDYDQYHRLTEIVGGSKHGLVVLTGDVHYGRIARSRLRSGALLVEIISSPMSLVDEKAKGSWKEAPERFPAVRPGRAAPGALVPIRVATERTFSPNDAHFLTLEFTRLGVGARLRLRYWPIVERGVTPPEFGRTIWDGNLS